MVHTASLALMCLRVVIVRISVSMSLPLLIIPGDCVERERLRFIALLYNLPYRDFLFLLFFHPAYIVVFVKLQGNLILRKIKYSVHMHVISNWVKVFVQVTKDDRNARCQSNTKITH